MSSPPPLPPEGSAPPPGKKFPCMKCGAKLDFDPSSRALKCPFCGNLEKIEPSNKAVAERDLEEYLSRETGKSVVQGRAFETKCGTCGAVVLLEDKVAADHCPYCAAFLENKPQAAEAMIAPECILPFAITNDKAMEAFQKWMASLWFLPSGFRQLAKVDKMNGLYLPFWTFDSMTYTYYSGSRGDNYTETEWYTDNESYTDSDGTQRTRPVQKTRQVTKTRWTRVTGEVRHFFDDIPVCASTSLPEHYTAALTAKELGDLEPFRPEFLSGFLTERYTLGPKEGFAKAKVVMDAHIRTLCNRDIGGDQQRLERVETQHVGVTFKHLLLPVYLASYRFRDKPYRVMVNGQTGHVLGDRPYSFGKIFGLIGTILLVIASIILLIMMLAR